MELDVNRRCSEQVLLMPWRGSLQRSVESATRRGPWKPDPARTALTVLVNKPRSSPSGFFSASTFRHSLVDGIIYEWDNLYIAFHSFDNTLHLPASLASPWLRVAAEGTGPPTLSHPSSTELSSACWRLYFGLFASYVSWAQFRP